MDLLPADLLENVLRRLRPHDLAPCRRVCRDWRASVDATGALLPDKVAGTFLNVSTCGTDFFARPTASPAIRSMLEYVPADVLVRGHCDGLLVLPGVVVNPAARRWFPSFFYHEHLVFDPAASPYYEVFLAPEVPYFKSLHGAKTGELAEGSEWPPSPLPISVFSSKTRQWEERAFLREAGAAGTVADMRLQDYMWPTHKQHQSVFHDEALFVPCNKNFTLRISMSSDKYRVIKPPAGIEASQSQDLYMGKTKKGVNSASVHDRCRLRIWFLDESCGQTEWVLEHQIDLGPVLTQYRYGEQIVIFQLI